MSGPRKNVGILLPPAVAYSPRILEGLMRHPQIHQKCMVIECPHFEPGRSPLLPGASALDAAIVWAEPRDHWVHDLIAQGTRILSCGAEWDGTPGVASVYFDRPEMHRMVIDHLKSLGLRTAVGMGHKLGLRPASRRLLEGFAEMARGEGIDAQVWSLEGEGSPAMAPGRLLQAHAEHQLADFLRTLKLPAAMLCASDQMAVIVCEVAARQGLRVPEDVVVIGESDNPLAATTRPPLTSIAGNAVALGETAAVVLIDWLAGGAPPSQPVIISGARLVARESSTGRSESVAIERVRRLIERDAVRGISLAELVAASGLSTKTMVRHYRAAFGVDPIDEVNRLRLAEAKRLLVSGPSKVAEVAASCGFSSPAAFNNYFRRHAGCSPSAYQQAAAGVSESAL
ncbi:substrate-binding domain-containing protein [Luteolibacter arcticus]|uniref:Substrate-binding domain-containing protein n=1 Tax=Luteolibacter arcticus TaxID=1581411 RepID=A0ABT3GH20_9BACT|nr:substrate-binding domain-containing protein [Luteolibacter arcticus]MCW1922917.1 substrate-binding domain-containing protein [Luteolibacter arcticus]